MSWLIVRGKVGAQPACADIGLTPTLCDVGAFERESLVSRHDATVKITILIREGFSMMAVARRTASWVSRLIVCIAVFLGVVRSGSETWAQTPNTVERFKARLQRFEKVARDLYASGTRVQRPGAAVWVSAQDMSAAEQEELADAISNGIDEIEGFLRLSFGSSPIEYFVTREFGDTSSYYPGPPPRIFLALSRIKTGEATHLHEAVHHLVFKYARDRSPVVHRWLFEGFPNFVQPRLQGELAVGTKER